MSVLDKLAFHKITLPPVSGPFGAYVPARRVGNLSQALRQAMAVGPLTRGEAAGIAAAALVVTTGAVVDGLEHHHSAAGLVRFDHDGSEHTLVAFGEVGGPLRVLFTDATSGVTTYPAARALDLGVPDENNTVTLDFTRAANLPCAFTDAATCPIAPAENRLPFAVEAGERNPRTSQNPE